MTALANRINVVTPLCFHRTTQAIRMIRAMHELAPRAVRVGTCFARRPYGHPADVGPFIVGSPARGLVLVAPTHGQNFPNRITFGVAGRAV